MRKYILKLLPVSLIVILLLTITEYSVGMNSTTKSASTVDNPSTQPIARTATEGAVQNVKKTETKVREYGIDENGVVTFDNKYFDYLHYEIEQNPLKYKDKEVIITGFVYKSPDFQENEFKVARMVSSFCADPAYVLGLMTRIENADDFKHREWVTVKGKLVVTSYSDPKTRFTYRKVHLEPESIEKIETRADYFLY